MKQDTPESRYASRAVNPLIQRLVGSSYLTKISILLLTDIVILNFSLWAAVSLRTEMIWPPLWQHFYWLFAAVPLFSLPVFLRLGLYRAVIRYTGLNALWVIFQAVCASSLLLVGLLFIHGFQGFPRSLPLIYFSFAFLLVGGSRLFFRYLYFRYAKSQAAVKRVLIYGAGSSGRQMLTAFKDSAHFEPVAFVDDDKTLQKRRLYGLRIAAPDELADLIEDFEVDVILLAMPSVTRARKREILRLLESFSVEVKSLPTLDALVAGKVSIEQIQDIQVEDLLGRDPVPPRMELIHSCVLNKSVMVTGAGGSIGSELCRQIAGIGPARLVLFERSEFALYTIESELRSQYGDRLEIVPVLGSVCRKNRVAAVLSNLKVQTVYHAAAYKHVPLVEYNPIEGVRNNLFGTWMLAEAAVENGVETFVFISTDKAVRPTNVMGASKRMAELVLQALAVKEGKIRFTMVRFGNVLGSSGSVVPQFRKQIAAGGPVTVTHPDVIRYFMTIPEAVELVLQTGAMGKGGDVFVLDMGQPVRILDLARKMIHLCGCTVRDHEKPNGDIPIEYTGLRPGEKLFEELLVGANVVGTEHPMIMRALEEYLPWEELLPVLEALEAACEDFSYEQIRTLLMRTVEGYLPQCDIVDPVWLSRAGKADADPKAKPVTLYLKKG
jgi:FlaA1/EpsC-like NDP-sugar epimerase